MRFRSTLAVGSPTARIAAILAATLLLALTLAGVGLAGSRLLAADATIVVDATGEGTVTTLAAGIELARDGDTILLRPGSYVEAVTIAKDITITGDGPPEDIVLEAPEDGPTLRIGRTSQIDPYALLLKDSEATVRGLTLRGESSQIHIVGGAPVLEDIVIDGVGRPAAAERGFAPIPNSIVIVGPSDAIVRNNQIRGAGPISIYDGAEPLVEGNTLTGGSMITVYDAGNGAAIRENAIDGARDSGIFVAGTGTVTIEGNLITGAGRDGILVGHHGTAGIEPVVRSNTIRLSKRGIHVDSEAAPHVLGNTLERNGTGLLTGSGSNGMVVADNDFSDNGVGIAITGSDARFEGNRIRGGTSGIVMEAGGSPTVVGNTIEGASAHGVLIGGRSSPILDGDHLCDNAQDLVAEAGGDDVYRASNTFCSTDMAHDPTEP